MSGKILLYLKNKQFYRITFGEKLQQKIEILVN